MVAYCYISATEGHLQDSLNQMEPSDLATVVQCSSGPSSHFLANIFGAAIPQFLRNTQFYNLCSSLDKGTLMLSATEQFCVSVV
jgi:hypothetical protein